MFQSTDALPLIIIIPFLLAAISPALCRLSRTVAGWVLAGITASLFWLMVDRAPAIAAGAKFHFIWPWIPSQGIDLSFLLDGLSLLFGLMISGIGTLVLAYSGYYMDDGRDAGRLFGYLMMFMGSMLGVAFAGDLITLFVFWELTTVTSFFLIGFKHEDESARRSAVQALFVTAGFGLVMLAGFVLLGEAAGTYSFPSLLKSGDLIRTHPHYMPILLLIALGAFAKSAQFPFHFWLPAAMTAPTPVSAYLHSATMVKAGIYLLARLYPALGDTESWRWLLTGAGLITMLVAAVAALRQTDLKLVLAHMTVLVLGLLTFLLGFGTENAIKAAVVYMLGHSLYKAALFLVVGIVDKKTGTRNVSELGGLAKRMPATAVAAVAAGLSMAGLPPLFGFIAKESVYEGFIASRPASLFSALAMSSVVAASLIVVARPFFGRPPSVERANAARDSGLLAAPLVLGLLGLALGLWPNLVADLVLSPAIIGVSGREIELRLTLWHGFTPALILSMASLIAGIVLFAFIEKICPTLSWTGRLSDAAGPAAWYRRFIHATGTSAHALTGALQNGSLRSYLIWIALFALTTISIPLIGQWGIGIPTGWEGIRYYEWILGFLILLGVAVAVVADSPLLAITALGASGYGISLIFVLFGAPDLAMTQFLVETLTIILVALVFVHLPALPALRKKGTLLVTSAFVSLCLGLTLTLLIWGTIRRPLDPFLSDYFNRQAVPLAHGRNIVNVILVDFRALDTLGEVIVVSLTGIGVVSLLKLRSRKGNNK